MMDPLAIQAAEAAVHVSYPPGAGAVLLVELDGPHARESNTSSPRSNGSATSAAPSTSGSRRTRRNAR